MFRHRLGFRVQASGFVGGRGERFRTGVLRCGGCGCRSVEVGRCKDASQGLGFKV